MNAIDRINAVKANRAASNLVSSCGVSCPNEHWLAYYNARAKAVRDSSGRIVTTQELRDLKSAATLSTARNT